MSKKRATPTQPTRGPGRPKKDKITSVMETLGVVSKPNNPDNAIEAIYSNPMIFKKLIALEKAYSVEGVLMIFTPDKILVNTTDHDMRSHIFVTIHGNVMNSYYCDGYYELSISCEYLTKILNTVTNTYDKIMFILTKSTVQTAINHTRDTVVKPQLQCVLHDAEYSTEDVYDIPIYDLVTNQSLSAATPILNTFDDSEYPASFTFSMKHFKKRVTNCAKLSTTLRIIKHNNGALEMGHNTVGSEKLRWQSTYKDPKKINLELNNESTDMINIGVDINYLKYLSDAAPGDDITIAVHKSKPISFTTKLDKVLNGWVMVIKIYTDLKTEN